MRRVRVLQLRGDMTIDELVNSLTRKGGRGDLAVEEVLLAARCGEGILKNGEHYVSHVRMAFVVDVLRRVMPADQIEEEKIELKAIPYD
jgi:hypothetical protein